MLFLPLNDVIAQTSDFTLVAVGDISCGPDSSSGYPCKDWATSEVARQINPNAYAILGDLQYEAGQYDYFMGNNSFCNSTPARCYNNTWGRLKSKSKPAPGNHEYGTRDAKGYFDYFNGIGVQTGIAGDRSKGYYAYDAGAWRVYVLNSNCAKIGGCNAGSAQETWLRQDMAANPKQCNLLYMHHPLWGSQPDHAEPLVKPLYKTFYDKGGDLILTGHMHFYERFARMNPDGAADNLYGLRQIIVGTGGRNTYGPPTVVANSERRSRGGDFGVLKVVLKPSSYTWEFVPITGQTFADSGSDNCHGVPGSAQNKQGDIDRDEDVDIFDHNILVRDWGRTSSVADIDGNGTVGQSDFEILKSNFGR